MPFQACATGSGWDPRTATLTGFAGSAAHRSWRYDLIRGVVVRRAIIFGLLTCVLLLPPSTGISQPAKPTSAYVNAIRALWVSMKKQLAGPNGQEYFTTSIQGADVPALIGTLLSATPNDRPSTLVLSMSDGITPEVTLHLKDDNNRKDSHVNGPIMRGSQIQFEGIPVAFTQNPFMLTFDVLLGAEPGRTPRLRILTGKDQ